ncbi:hypothetical protein KC906_02960 [Candidatus Kaiserbacteria bacterium]|nr:hypothetical protein [Candidatus Kaiserbacteria bacterium]
MRYHSRTRDHDLTIELLVIYGNIIALLLKYRLDDSLLLYLDSIAAMTVTLILMILGHTPITSNLIFYERLVDILST